MQVVGSHYSMVLVWRGVYTDDGGGGHGGARCGRLVSEDCPHSQPRSGGHEPG